jgi:hypothetical protein
MAWALSMAMNAQRKVGSSRFIWSGITPTSCHWEQAYSPDEATLAKQIGCRTCSERDSQDTRLALGTHS